ncbi:hypothetical protein ACFZBM_22475 [Streptomyces lavendulae]|uniref:Uncharacterized protein n=1 Tax=Streptomyces lavendulae subsp. lavendulae TaxID=58340 RepID=A0A2K8PPW7_STRLA|nr:hypothetical protein [Streptomyces lavendulae]ATZ28749.1 hypothetical protein SLAV_34895 [Streptomyces lavendulae subsp. lavendulae]QUQ58574.1 hypothetical protein SLLC_33070 [Streptomyces lavendulae subsp. lavendulae]
MASGLRLMLLMGPVLAVPVPAPLADALQSVRVTTASGQASGFQLAFAVSARSVIQRALLPAGFFDPGVRVVLVCVVAGTPTVLADGIVTQQELSPSAEPGASVLTVTGEDLTVLMDVRHERACFPGLPHQARVAAICAKYAVYGIAPVAVPPVLTDVPNPLVHVPVQASTDLEYLKAMASEVGYVFFLEPGPLPGASVAYWGPEVRTGPVQPALTLGAGAAATAESLSFTYDGLSRTQYTVSVTEPVTKVGIGLPVPDVSLLHPPLAARPAVTLKQEPLPDVGDRSPAEALLLGLSRTSTAADAVRGTGKLDVLRYGHVLRARRLVGVRGAGPAYDGLYYVSSVTHDIRRGEYKQGFTLTRDGLGSLTPVVIP